LLFLAFMLATWRAACVTVVAAACLAACGAPAPDDDFGVPAGMDGKSDRSSLEQCEVDTDCVALPAAQCCVEGLLVAIAAGHEEAHAESWPDCAAERCMPTQVTDPRVAACVNGTCQMIDPLCDVAGRVYSSRDTVLCSALRIMCGTGKQRFSDRCGCGCEPKA
jgi:hypothetical protein